MSDKDDQQKSNTTEGPDTEKTDPPHTENSANYRPELTLKEMLARDRLRNELREATLRKRSADRRRTMYTASAIMLAMLILLFVSARNPSIYNIDEGTLSIVNQALNATILLVIPFLLGILGATARILIATVKPEHKGNLLISSGLMATFSWIGIKSGVLISIIAPHLEKSNIPSEHTLSTSHDFYTMALVAIVVGMFSTNLYLVVSEKVEQITQQVKNQKATDKKRKQKKPSV